MAVGDSDVWLKSGENRFRIGIEWGSHIGLDFARFTYTGTPVESTTWGSVKNMYR
jgi:hypothetical protein